MHRPLLPLLFAAASTGPSNGALLASSDEYNLENYEATRENEPAERLKKKPWND